MSEIPNPTNFCIEPYFFKEHIITCTATDGSGKSAKANIHVPVFHVDQTEYTVYSKDGIDIPVHWDSNVTLNLSQNSSCFTADWNAGNSFKVVPLKAGTGSVTLSSSGKTKDAITIKITISNSAAFDTQSYPKIDYKNAYRYPASYKYDPVSFSGTVNQVINKTTFRISSRGKYNDIVYVTISDSDLTTPLIEDDKVTVYGRLDGNYTYTTVLGSSMTIPKVTAEKIIVK